MWFLYLLLCKDKSIYTGITNNFGERLKAHKSGKGSRYTRSHKPEKLLHSERFKTKSAALKREAEIKKWPRHKKLDLVQ